MGTAALICGAIGISAFGVGSYFVSEGRDPPTVYIGATAICFGGAMGVVAAGLGVGRLFVSA